MTFDLDAVANEATAASFEFTFGGESFTLPPTIDVLAVASIEEGKLYDGLHRLLGDGQWERMLALDAVFDESKLVALLEAYGKHIGISLGE